MKVSELDLSAVSNYCRIIEEDLTDIEKAELEGLKRAAIKYCTGYTGLTEAQLDEHEDITIAVLTLIGDMYDNRQMYVDKAHINRTADTILGMHCVNWIPDEVISDGN
nr:MAG TPA: head tail connector [Caudoviricetes sp.]